MEVWGFRPRITKKKHVFFFCPARALDCCRFPKKTQSISIACFFKIGQKFFFIYSPSLTFPEICLMFFLFRRPH